MAIPETVSTKIAKAFPGLSRRQKQVARFVADNEQYVACAPVAEVAQKAGVSTATVVRFCQGLGYEGYIHLQTVLREQISFQRTAVQRLEEQLASPITKGDLLTQVFATDMHNIERTAALTASDHLQAAADRIRRARQILVVGGGATTAAVGFFAHALQVIGLSAQGIIGGGEPLALALAFLRPEDVVIGIGYWRNLRDVVEAIQQALEVGATTIGITDSRLSPLALLPEYRFLVATDGVAHSLSPVATLALLNVFVAILSFDAPEQVIRSVRLVDEAYRRNSLLAE